MFKIGDFSRLCQISIRMLRFYDETNILKPALIDDKTGYRYYDANQLEMTIMINFLRKTGFTTVEIKEIIAHYNHKEQLLEAIYAKQKELESEILLVQNKIIKLKNAQKQLESEKKIMNYKIEVKEIPEQYMMCKRDIIPSYDKEYLLWEGLKNELKSLALDVRYCSNVPTRAYFYDEGFKEKDVDVEICVAVEKEYESTENIIFKVISTKKCVSVTYQGGYDKIAGIHFIISNWIIEHDCQLDGPNFTIYHVSPSDTNNPDEYVTEVCFPIK